MSSSDLPADVVQLALAATPARLLVGRAGTSYSTATSLQLRADHAAARDAVYADLDLSRDFGEERHREYGLFWTQTAARTRTEFLMRPDLGRRLDRGSSELIAANCPRDVDLQVVVGDGLSATAVATQAPVLLDRLAAAATAQGWRFGRPFLVRNCRVGVLNDVGDLLHPSVVVLLIGERPGLATAESLSAYLAYRPRSGHTDANRNLISNIHARGIDRDQAVQRIISLALAMCRLEQSGLAVKEDLQSVRQVADLSRQEFGRD